MIFLISFENPLDGFLVLSLPQGFELQMDFSRIKKNQSYSKLKVTSQEHFQYFDFDGFFFVRLVICNLLIFCLPSNFSSLLFMISFLSIFTFYYSRPIRNIAAIFLTLSENPLSCCLYMLWSRIFRITAKGLGSIPKYFNYI